MKLTEESCAYYSCVVSKVSSFYYSFSGNVTGIVFTKNKLFDGVYEGVALLGNTATDADNIGLEYIDYIGYTHCNVINILVYYHLACHITATHCVKGGKAAYVIEVAITELPHNALGITEHCLASLAD